MKYLCVGTCNETSKCTCAPGWEGTKCERQINYCFNVTCYNRGVCRPLLLNYSCECLADSYYGQHCETTSTRIFIHQIISKTFAYIAIIAMCTVAMFVIIMDILKYCFGIDLTRKELEEVRRKKRAKKRKPVIQRFVYVNAPTSSEQPISTIKQTAI